MRILIAFLVGIIFGLGLIISGMSNPAKVIGFLDISGAWDPSLALVMAGAILVAMPAFLYVRKRERDLTGELLQLPTETKIDKPLIIGAIIFGTGWGLSGYCPGPAVVSLATASLSALIFVVGMLAGIGIFKLLRQPK